MIKLFSLGNEKEYVYNPIIRQDGKYYTLIRQARNIKNIDSFSFSNPMLEVIVKRHRIEGNSIFLKKPLNFRSVKDLIAFLKAEDERMGKIKAEETIEVNVIPHKWVTIPGRGHVNVGGGGGKKGLSGKQIPDLKTAEGAEKAKLEAISDYMNASTAYSKVESQRCKAVMAGDFEKAEILDKKGQELRGKQDSALKTAKKNGMTKDEGYSIMNSSGMDCTLVDPATGSSYSIWDGNPSKKTAKTKKKELKKKEPEIKGKAPGSKKAALELSDDEFATLKQGSSEISNTYKEMNYDPDVFTFNDRKRKVHDRTDPIRNNSLKKAGCSQKDIDDFDKAVEVWNSGGKVTGGQINSPESIRLRVCNNMINGKEPTFGFNAPMKKAYDAKPFDPSPGQLRTAKAMKIMDNEIMAKTRSSDTYETFRGVRGSYAKSVKGKLTKSGGDEIEIPFHSLTSATRSKNTAFKFGDGGDDESKWGVILTEKVNIKKDIFVSHYSSRTLATRGEYEAILSSTGNRRNKVKDLAELGLDGYHGWKGDDI